MSLYLSMLELRLTLLKVEISNLIVHFKPLAKMVLRKVKLLNTKDAGNRLSDDQNIDSIEQLASTQVFEELHSVEQKSQIVTY